MDDQSFTTTFTVDRTPQDVFAAVTDPRAWWSEEIDGPTSDVGDEFDYHFEDVHRAKLRVTEVIPQQKVSWLVLENHFNFTEDDTEWTGTTITFEIVRRGDRTQLAFTHHGLVPEYECFELCRKGWDFYINTSLQNLLTTGQGRPNATSRPQLAHEAELSR
ncbi:SRPBCC family protein [Kribbella swartbergensis]